METTIPPSSLQLTGTRLGSLFYFIFFVTLVNMMYITDKCEYVFVQNQQRKVVLRVCGIKKKQKKVNKKTYAPPSCFILWFFDFVLFLKFFLMMYVYDYQWVRMYVCKWLILYIWCSLRWKSRRCPCLISFLLLLFRPCIVPVGVFSDNYTREWLLFFFSFFFFLATAECDFTEKEAVWTGFLYGLI